MIQKKDSWVEVRSLNGNMEQTWQDKRLRDVDEAKALIDRYNLGQKDNYLILSVEVSRYFTNDMEFWHETVSRLAMLNYPNTNEVNSDKKSEH